MFDYPDDIAGVEEYEVVGEVGAGLILVESRYGRQIWVECVKRLNTHKLCEMCNEDQYHQLSYRPMNNPKNRSHRICLICVKERMIVKPEMLKVVR